jgi:hypothetical protein
VANFPKQPPPAQATMEESPKPLVVGAWLAVFEGVESGGGNPDYGSSITFRFRLITGPDTGKLATRIVSTKWPPNPGNAYGRMLAGLNGGACAVGEVITFSAYLGRRYNVVIQPAGKGSRVDGVFPFVEAPPAPAPAG